MYIYIRILSLRIRAVWNTKPLLRIVLSIYQKEKKLSIFVYLRKICFFYTFNSYLLPFIWAVFSSVSNFMTIFFNYFFRRYTIFFSRTIFWCCFLFPFFLEYKNEIFISLAIELVTYRRNHKIWWLFSIEKYNKNKSYIICKLTLDINK